MNPTNFTSGCDPLSSTCVIWQGPDLPCISLCNGDNINTVIYKLATELCNLIATFNIENYELDCLGLEACAPKDFQALIQLLINKVCEQNGITPDPTPGTGGCPTDCVVPVCSSFQYTNPLGDLVTSMPLTDYVIAIGNRVCSLIGQIQTINNTLQDHETRIEVLENTPAPAPVLPEVTPVCVLPSQPTDMDEVLSALEQQFCTLQNHTGNPQAILLAMQAMCPGLNNAPVLNGSGIMSGLPGWFPSPANLAQSFSNLWKTVCDMRNAVAFIQANCCDTGCSAINMTVTGEVLNPTTIRLTFAGNIPNNFIDAPIGSSIEITDAGGGGPQVINGVFIKSQYYDTAQQYTITLVGVNAANDVTVKVTARFIDPIAETACENMIQILILGANSCPELNIVADYLGVAFAFTWMGNTPIVIGVQLWNALGTIMLQSQNINVTTTNPSGSFINLTQNTTYKIRLIINGQPCEFTTFATLIYPCIAPIVNASTIDTDNPTGDTNGTTIPGWIAEYDFHHSIIT